MKLYAVCGNGIGSSLMLKISVDKVLEELGRDDVELEHSDISSLAGIDADAVICSSDIAETCGAYGYPVISVRSIMDKNEIKEKLEAFFN